MKAGGSFPPNAVIQLALNPDWKYVKEVKQSQGSQIGVFFIQGNDGAWHVLKLEPKSSYEATASEFIRLMGGFAPETRVLYMNGKEISALKNAVLSFWGSGKKKELSEALNKYKGGTALLMEMVQGEELHESKVKIGNDPRVEDTALWLQLGQLAAYDLFLGNYDRTLIGMNLGNILRTKKGVVYGIDQTVEKDLTFDPQEQIDSILQSIDSSGYGNSAWAIKLGKRAQGVYELKSSPAPYLDLGFSIGIELIKEQYENAYKLIEFSSSFDPEAANMVLKRVASFIKAEKKKEEIQKRNEDIQRMVFESVREQILSSHLKQSTLL